MKDVYAIDYDDTFTLNPELWIHLLDSMRIGGINVICATSRGDTPANRQTLFQALEGRVVDIIFCGGRHKAEVCRQHGYKVLVWIDNDPRTDRRWAPLWWCRLVGAWASLFCKR